MRHGTPDEQADYRAMLERNSVPIGGGVLRDICQEYGFEYQRVGPDELCVEHLPPHFGSLTTVDGSSTTDGHGNFVMPSAYKYVPLSYGVTSDGSVPVGSGESVTIRALTDLIRDMHTCIVTRERYDAIECCVRCPLYGDDQRCDFEERMEEWGIEVEE